VRILGICGSGSSRSTNAALLRAAAQAAPGMQIAADISGLPHFDPGIGDPPAAVTDLQAQASAADGIVIASPEYAHSMPGSLKNALDWLVGSGSLAKKPVALMSASPTYGGLRSQIAIVHTLLAHSAEVVALLPIYAVRGKVDENGEFSDPRTLRRIRETMTALIEAAAADQLV
jgi:chromate reductase, NAD(P)H dehydrogenase (quinone)